MKNLTTTASIWCIFTFSLVSWSQQTIAPIAATLAPPSPSVLWEKEPFGTRTMADELVGSRDQFSKHFRNDDGTITAHIAAGPIHYLENGQWQTIYHSIVPNGNGFENVWNSHKTYYPKQANGAIQTVLPSGHTLIDMMGMRMYFEQNGQAVGVKQIQPKNGSAQFDELTYAGVYGNGIDLRLSQYTTKRKMDYIIQSKTALGIIPSGATHLIFEEKAQLPAGWTAVLVDNEILLKDAAGVVQAKYEKPVFNDSPVHNHEEGETITEEGHDHEILGDYIIQQSGNTLTIKTKVPLNWLLDEHRAFPVVVDPTVNCYPNDANNWTGEIETYSSTSSPDATSDTYLTSNITNSYNGDFYLGRSSGNYVHRGWAKFNISSVPDDACISAASFHYNVFSNATTDNNCVVNNHIRHMASDPVGATNAARLTDIRDGDIYQTTNFAIQGSGSGWRNRALTNNLHHLVNQLPVDWFSVGFHTFEGISGHITCYVGIRGHAHSDRPYLTVTYTDFTVSAGVDVTSCGSGVILSPSINVNPEACTYSISLFDTYGDGWNGGYVNIIVGGNTVISNATLSSGSGPVIFNFSVLAGQTINIAYTGGSYTFENYYRVFNGPNGTGTQLFASTENSTPPANQSITNSCSPPAPTITYSWSPATGLSATNIPNPTANPASTTTYTLTTSVNGCSKQDDVTVTVETPSTSPTSVTGGGNICHGTVVNLQATGGSPAAGAQTVWYQGGCNNAYTQNWTSQPFALINSTVNSHSNGILSLSPVPVDYGWGPVADPMIDMPGLGSFDPSIFRYINIRYRVASGTAGSVEAFFYNAHYPFAHGDHHTWAPLISDGQWHVATIDMYQNPHYLGDGSNITGWRYDWATGLGCAVELDFIQLSQFPMLDENTSDNLLTLTPGASFYPAAGTTTYAAARIDNCGATSCASTTVTLPTAGSTLGLNGESATCVVNQNGWVHFYHSSGRLIGSINSQGQNLGSVTMTVYVDGANQQVPACDDPTNPSFFTAVMQRHWVVDDNPVGALTPNIQVRVPFYNTELSNLVTASGSNVNPTDNVGAIGDVLMSRYHGPINVDHIAINNCTQNGGNGNTVIHTQNWNGLTTAYSNVTAASYIVYTVPEFSELWLHGQLDMSPLPVQLSSFNALCEEHGVRVEWITASEQNSAHFVIEKSRDGLTWEVLGTLAAAGNSNTANFYQINDNNTSGVVYYRMIQVDMDGEQKIYGPISTNCGEKTDELSVYPNPSSGEFSIQLTTEQFSQNSRLVIYDLTGKQVYDYVQDIQPGTTTHLVQPNTLARGTYTIRVENTNGNFQPVKLVIQ